MTGYDKVINHIKNGGYFSIGDGQTFSWKGGIVFVGKGDLELSVNDRAYATVLDALIKGEVQLEK